MEKQYFSLYSFAIPVKGRDQSIICNLYNAGYTIIPDFLHELLTTYLDNPVEKIIELYNDKSGEIEKYFDYLITKGLGTYVNRIGFFPQMRMDWASSSILKYAILKINNINTVDYKDLLNRIIDLGCRHIEIWLEEISIELIEDILSSTDNTSLRSIDLYTMNDEVIGKEIYKDLYYKLSKLNVIYVHNCSIEEEVLEGKIFFKSDNLTENQFSKDAEADEYIIYTDFFAESQNHNPYYNNKVCIDEHGYVKNCFQHNNHFGNIKSQNIEEIVLSGEFQELWFACNDKIIGIRDSPFRYIWLNTHQLKKIDTNLYEIIK